jgi:dihydroneopterin aldolase
VGVISIRGLRETGVHGVLPEEQARAQPFEVDVALELDLTAAGRSDALDDTLDYGDLAETVARIVRSEHYALLERLASRIADACRADPRVERATVTVRKLRPPVPVQLDHVAVTVTA